MKTLSLLFALLLIPAQAREKTLDDLAWDENAKTFLAEEQAWMAAAPREVLIDEYLKKRQAATVSDDYTTVMHLEKRLVVLEHVETIQECIESMQRYGANGGSAVEGTPTETTIPYLIPLLFRGSTIPEPTAEPDPLLRLTPRDRAAMAILHALRRRLAFPDETRHWADNMHRILPFPMREQRVNLVKQWWEHNKKAMEERRYADATWLPPDYKGEPSYLSPEEVNELKAKTQEITDRRAGDSHAPLSMANARKTGESDPASRLIRSSGQTVGIILAALFAIIATLVWKLKKSSVKS